MKKKEMNGPPAGRWLRLENFRFVLPCCAVLRHTGEQKQRPEYREDQEKGKRVCAFHPHPEAPGLDAQPGQRTVPASLPQRAIGPYPTQGQGTHSLQHGKSGASGRVFAVLWCTCSECSSTRRRFDWTDELWCVRRDEPRRNSGKAEKRGKSGQTNPTTEQASSSPRCAALHPAKQSDRLERCFSPHKPQKPEKPFCRVAGLSPVLLP